MEVAMRHGVLGYEAMGLSPAFFIFRFGVFIYEATRCGRVKCVEACRRVLPFDSVHSEVLQRLPPVPSGY
jgi:hypothetical protein